MQSRGLLAVAGIAVLVLSCGDGAVEPPPPPPAPVATTVVLLPAARLMGPGDTGRLLAEAFDASGRRVSSAVFTWSSSNDSVATVDASGLVRDVGRGRPAGRFCYSQCASASIIRTRP